MPPSSASSTRDSEGDGLNPDVPDTIIKHLIIRMRQLESSISSFHALLKGSLRLARSERETIKANIKEEESQKKALLMGLDVAMPNWKDLEITAKDQEDYRQYLLSTKAPGDQNNQISGNREVRAIPGQSTSAQNPVYIPPKSVFVVPIPKKPHQMQLHAHTKPTKDSENASLQRRRVRDKTPENEQSTADFPPYTRPLFTLTKNWVTHFKPIEIMFLDHTSSKSEEERAWYLKETIDSSLHATLCLEGDRFLCVAEINRRGMDLFGPKKDAPFFCEVHGFGTHLTGDCTDSKKFLCERCREVLTEGVEHRCLVTATAGEDAADAKQQEDESQDNAKLGEDTAYISNSNEEETARPYCALCYANDGTKIEGSYDHMFEFHYVEKEDEEEEQRFPPSSAPVPNSPTKQEDYGWRRDNYYKGKNIEGLDKPRDMRGRPIKKKKQESQADTSSTPKTPNTAPPSKSRTTAPKLNSNESGGKHTTRPINPNPNPRPQYRETRESTERKWFVEARNDAPLPPARHHSSSHNNRSEEQRYWDNNGHYYHRRRSRSRSPPPSHYSHRSHQSRYSHPDSQQNRRYSPPPPVRKHEPVLPPAAVPSRYSSGAGYPTTRLQPSARSPPPFRDAPYQRRR